MLMMFSSTFFTALVSEIERNEQAWNTDECVKLIWKPDFARNSSFPLNLITMSTVWLNWRQEGVGKTDEETHIWRWKFVSSIVSHSVLFQDLLSFSKWRLAPFQLFSQHPNSNRITSRRAACGHLTDSKEKQMLPSTLKRWRRCLHNHFLGEPDN